MNLKTPGATKLLGALSLVLIAAAGWMLVLGPKTTALALVQEQSASARSQNELLGLQLVRLEKEAAHLDDTRVVARALAAKFPPTADQPGLFGQVTQAAAAAGIGARDVTAVTPTPPTIGVPAADGSVAVQPETDAAANLAHQTVTVSVEGTFAATQELLENLESIPRAFLVSSVTVGAGSTARNFTTTVTGDMFVMPPAPDPADVKAETDAETGDSGAEATGGATDPSSAAGTP